MAITVTLNIESTMKTALSLLATMLVATLTSASAVATQCNLNSQYLKADYTITNTHKNKQSSQVLTLWRNNQQVAHQSDVTTELSSNIALMCDLLVITPKCKYLTTLLIFVGVGNCVVGF